MVDYLHKDSGRSIARSIVQRNDASAGRFEDQKYITDPQMPYNENGMCAFDESWEVPMTESL